MIEFITFTDENMVRSACKCLESAMKLGAMNTRLFTKAQIEHWDVVQSNPEVFRQPEDHRRAWAWWAWKPVIIKRAINDLSDGDFLIYSDAGIEVINHLEYITERIDQDVWLFGNMWEHSHWCKRDTVEAVWPSVALDPLEAWVRFGKQCQATVMAFKVSDYSRKFVKEWFNFCMQPHLINDSPSIAPNHEEFREHRHDQAILTTMAYREGIKLHWWPAMYNDGAFTYERGTYKDEGYPALFNHHRRRDHEWQQVA